MAPRREPLNSEIEDEMLGGVPGFDDELPDDLGGNDDVDTGAEEISGGQRPDPRTEVGDELDPRGNKRGKDDPNQKRQQDDQQVRYDQQGNVIDARGNIIAPAGRARRLDEQNKRYKGMLEGKDAEILRLKTQVAEGNFLNGAPAKLGLSADETAAALDMMALFKNNPGQLVQVVLAEAQARGLDVNKLLGANIGAVNTDAISRMLDQRLAPLDKINKEREAEVRLNNAVTERYTTFLSTYPDAEPHQDAIAALMRDQNINETVAYFRVREFALRNGLDFNHPLGPQLQELIASRRGQSQQPQRHQRRPIINGRAPSGNQMTERKTNVASPDRSFASIIDEAMQEAGFD